MKIINDISYGKAGHPEQKLDMYLPESESFKVFVYIHGGGIESGDKKGTKIVGEFLAKNNIAFVSINYRMYPQAVYPEYIRDAAEAVGWIYKNITSYGKCDGIYIGGSSAGGYISMMLCFDNKYLAPYKISSEIIRGYIHDAGQPTTHFNILRERGIDAKRVIVDEAAPLFHIGRSSSYPPMLFIVSDDDMENRYEQTQLVISTLRHFRYNENAIKLQLMHGKHCQYTNTEKFGEIVCDFIKEN